MLVSEHLITARVEQDNMTELYIYINLFMHGVLRGVFEFFVVCSFLSVCCGGMPLCGIAI